MPPDGIAEFCAGVSDGALATRLAQDVAAGTVRPEWCWLAVDGDRVVARHHWWGPAGAVAPIVLVPVDAQGDDEDAAVALVAHARDSLQVRDAWAEITIPGSDGDPWRDRPERVRLLERAGFVFSVDRVRVEWTGADREVAPPSSRLALAAADTLTEDDLVELFAAVADESLDHGMHTERAVLGRTEEARRRVEFLRGYPGIDGRMYVATDSGGSLVGYVAAADHDGTGVIAEIGVAAASRGQRYVDDLLATGLKALTAAGVARVVADTDLANVPMRQAFERAGFREFARRWDWGWRRAS
jgi:ribosomal protein S18 acetylase RimI-like enzyme